MRILLFALLLAPAAAAAQEASIAFRLTPSATSFRLGDQFTVKVEAELPDRYALAPDTASADTENFDLQAFTRTGGSAAGGRRTEVYEIRAQAFALGVSTFPQITWTLTAPGGEPARAKSPPFAVSVAPNFEIKQDEDIRDIYPPLRFVPWLLILLALAGLTALAWWLYDRYGPKEGLLAPAARGWKDAREPYQRARDRLDKLAACSLPKAGRIKEFYIGITSILRLYLKEEFAIDAAQMTTADLARELKATGAGLKTGMRTREFLQKADLVKFARLQPEDAEADTEALRELLGQYTQAAEKAKAEKAAAEALAKAAAALQTAPPPAAPQKGGGR